MDTKKRKIIGQTFVQNTVCPATQWLSYLANSQRIFIRHKFNTGENRVSKYSPFVDGYSSSTNRVYQFDGCFFHGCEKYSTNCDYSGNIKEINSLTGKNIKDLQKVTQENTEKLEEEGFSVCRITECEWQQMKQHPEISFFFKTLK